MVINNNFRRFTAIAPETTQFNEQMASDISEIKAKIKEKDQQIIQLQATID
jgi:hypothetical protein